MSERKETGVVLPAGHTGSSLFHRVLCEAAQAFPDVFAEAALPDAVGAFKRGYGEALVRFEAARVSSPRRVEIARYVARQTQRHLLLAGEDGSAPLEERLAVRAQPPALVSHKLRGRPGLAAEVPLSGQTHRGRGVIALAEQLSAAHQLTDGALAAVRWIVEHIEGQGGALSLEGRRFVLLGAGAELAPTPALLAAGADVLWVDVVAPDALLGRAETLAGQLWLPEGVGDLLQQPREVAAAISRFAEAGPVHLGMFAYAGGASREWRLGAAMNAIARSLDPALVASVSLFVSPTTAASMQPEDVRASEQRLASRPFWQSALRAAGALPTPGHLARDGHSVSRSIVSIQGLSYQAAQYISKISAAETYACYGLALERDEPSPLTVSANVAGITNTRSLSHPLFQAAFLGAPRFGVRIFEPSTTRALAGLLLLHDLQNPEAPGSARVAYPNLPARAERLLSQQVHGGIYGLPYELEPAIRAAAVIGMARRPSVLFRSSGKK